MPRYWFRPKSYGYGATPTTWEGWVVTIGLAAAIAISVVTMTLLADRSNFAAWIVWAAIVTGIAFWFVRLSRRRTEGEWRWRWGDRSDG